MMMDTLSEDKDADGDSCDDDNENDPIDFFQLFVSDANA